MLNVHASGGIPMMEAALAGVKAASVSEKPQLIAVTVLTSMNQTTLAEVGIETSIEELETILKDDSATKEQIEEKVKTLTEKSHKLAEAIYAKEEQGKADPKAKKADDDDVIDAEVE